MQSVEKDKAGSQFTPLLTVSDLARYLALSKSMIYKLVDEGKVPYIKIGKAIRFKRDDINIWITLKTIGPQDTGTDNNRFEKEVDNILNSTRIRNKL